jgi:hypothetical protein
MKKLLCALLLFTTLAFSQKYKIIKVVASPSSLSLGVKMDGVIIIKNDTLHIETEYKGLKSNSDLKIVNTIKLISEEIKQVYAKETYQAIGNWNMGDKHQITIFSNEFVLWKKINSFDNTSVDMYFKIEEIK